MSRSGHRRRPVRKPDPASLQLLTELRARALTEHNASEARGDRAHASQTAKQLRGVA